MSEVQRIRSALLQRKVEFDVSGEYEGASVTNRGDGGVGQSEPRERGIGDQQVAWIIHLLRLFDKSLQQRFGSRADLCPEDPQDRLPG